MTHEQQQYILNFSEKAHSIFVANDWEYGVYDFTHVPSATEIQVLAERLFYSLSADPDSNIFESGRIILTRNDGPLEFTLSLKLI